MKTKINAGTWVKFQEAGRWLKAVVKRFEEKQGKPGYFVSVGNVSSYLWVAESNLVINANEITFNELKDGKIRYCTSPWGLLEFKDGEWRDANGKVHQVEIKEQLK